MVATWRPEWLRSMLAIDVPEAWRGVETQYLSATLRLIDNGAEHELLESMLEISKPDLPPTAAPRQHYLLTTPFRYTPVRASRFRAAGQHGIWYGALTLQTACAEVAYWRMVFVLDSVALRDREIRSQHTFFAARVHGPGIDLTASPWVAARAMWTNGSDYAGSHALAAAAAPAGVQVIQYESVRDRGGVDLAVLTPTALQEPVGGLDASRQAWTCLATKDRVKMLRDGHADQGFDWSR